MLCLVHKSSLISFFPKNISRSMMVFKMVLRVWFQNWFSRINEEYLWIMDMAGSWLHCGYHLTTSIVAPVLLSLPYAMGLLGWVAGVVWLALAALVTFYSYNLLSLVLEHHAKLGHRHLRFRDMATHILGGLLTFFPTTRLLFNGEIR